jgi:uncharacterized membrane protein
VAAAAVSYKLSVESSCPVESLMKAHMHGWLQNLEHALGVTTGAATERTKRILKHLAERRIISRDVQHEMKAKETFGERLADRVAELGGSWGFISFFIVFLIVWAIVNTIVLIVRPPDPYPFIFLNLLLSMLAALQAPIIMMSQNRQAAKDRAEAQHDYEVNLKAELEIMALHEKVDQLRAEQFAQVLAKQEEQTALLAQLVKAKA